MHSCLYEGVVTHRRREPVTHGFRRRLYMAYLDLDELPGLVERGGPIDSGRYSRSSFHRSDHLFDPTLPLADEVREIIRQRTGQTPGGPIRLLTQLRCRGYYFSPLNLYYVFDEGDQHVENVVAEVSNTPWNERHCYVLGAENRTRVSHVMGFSHPKEFHVSPFMGMDMQYQWRLTQPGERLAVHLSNTQGATNLFSASMALARHELNPQSLRRMTRQYPLITAQISAVIYYQALRLWWKRCPYYAHPRKKSPPASKVQEQPREASSMTP
jgi:DUF1365 family protein